APPCLYQWRLAELPAQIGDIPVDEVQAACVWAPPHVRQRGFASYHATLVPKQQLQQARLSGAQLDLSRPAPSRARCGLQREVPVREHLCRLSPTPQQRPNPSEQLL